MVSKPYVILVPDVQYAELDIEKMVTGDSAVYHVYHEDDPENIPSEEWRNCDAVLVWHRMKINAAVIDQLDKCKMIVRVGVGFDNVDTAACSRKGIPVSNVPNYGTAEVADHAIALLLNLVRGVSSYQDRLRNNLVTGFAAEEVPVVRRIRGGIFGAVGLGRIGNAVARRAKAFDMRVVFYDPYLSEGSDLAFGYERVRTLEELLNMSDIVSLHTPLTPDTRHMINERTLSQMKQSAILINVARGGLVDLAALYDALLKNRLSAAGLDVIEQEPPVTPGSLLTAWQKRETWLEGRIALTPHAAFYSEAGYRDMRTFSAETLKSWLVHSQLRNNVNPEWNRQ